MERQIEILFEDNDIIVCHKMAGVAVQSKSYANPDMESMLKNMLARREGAKKPVELYVIHRLDQPVEGIIVFAKSKKAAASLSKQVQSDGGMNKTYKAVVLGEFPEVEKEGELRNYLIKDSKNKCAVIVDANNKDAKEAVLEYKVLETKKVLEDTVPISLVEIHLQTGRFHQIRAQFSNVDHPLIGDRRYFNENSSKLSQELSVKNVALCATSLTFKHPVSGKKMEFKVEPTGDIFKTMN